MCIGCWVDYGSPALQNEKIEEAAKLIAEIYDYSCVGANAHIVIDDWNLEDEHVSWCLNDALTSNSHESPPDQIEIERKCLSLLLSMSIDERASALAIYDGYVSHPTP